MNCNNKATSKLITIRLNSSEEEITKELRAAPLDLTVKIAAAIGRLWQESV